LPRIVELEGAVNFRDFGGYHTTGGARVREGLLFRSGTMAGLTERGIRDFEALGIGVVCDLRRAAEYEEEPTPLPHDRPRRISIPIDPDSAVKLREALDRAPLDVERRIRFMIDINKELAHAHAADYRRMFDAMLDAEPHGFLVHCAAGKDRTGFGVALIQLALGVPRDAVMEDYLLTNVVVDFERFTLPRLRARYPDRQIDPEEARALSCVREDYLHAALRAAEDAFGSVDAYLERSLGVDAKQRARLEARLLT
jgi:protein-tyrosine phosphatase